MGRRVGVLAVVLVSIASGARAESARVNILRAEDRRAATPDDLVTIRAGLQEADGETVRTAVRALGRFERPSLIADLQPMLAHKLPAVRAEAATAIGQAAQGWRRHPPEGWLATLDATQTALIERLKIEPDASVRAALADTLGRLPYAQPPQVEIAERAILDAAGRGTSLIDHLGTAQGLFRLTRLHRSTHPFSPRAKAMLVELSGTTMPADVKPTPETIELAARVRRIALEG